MSDGVIFGLPIIFWIIIIGALPFLFFVYRRQGGLITTLGVLATFVIYVGGGFLRSTGFLGDTHGMNLLMRFFLILFLWVVIFNRGVKK